MPVILRIALKKNPDSWKGKRDNREGGRGEKKWGLGVKTVGG